MEKGKRKLTLYKKDSENILERVYECNIRVLASTGRILKEN